MSLKLNMLTFWWDLSLALWGSQVKEEVRTSGMVKRWGSPIAGLLNAPVELPSKHLGLCHRSVLLSALARGAFSYSGQLARVLRVEGCQRLSHKWNTCTTPLCKYREIGKGAEINVR